MTAASETEKREHDNSSQELAFDIRKIENCLEVGKVGILKANFCNSNFGQQLATHSSSLFLRIPHWVDPLILR
jgi:hypothetical protein